MRVLLIGAGADRARLRRLLGEHAVEIVAEAETVAEGRAVGGEADAIVLAPEPAAGTVEPLTPREREVLDLLAEGLPNKSIAARLGISEQTVKVHVSSICGKLNAENRTDAVRRGVRLGLVML